MIEKNYEFLTRALAKLGFEDKLNDALRTKMVLGMPAFDLRAGVKHGNNQMVHDLRFARKKEDGFYFLNSQQVTLKKEGQEPVTQNFTFFNQDGFNNKETFNLMEGRSVRNSRTIDGRPTPVWTYIDFKADKNDKGNYVVRNPKEGDLKFDIDAALKALPLQSMSPDDLGKLTKSLEGGNLTPATLKVDGSWSRVYLEATPTRNMVTAYDTNMQKISLSGGKVELLSDDTSLRKVSDTTEKLLKKEDKPAQGLTKKVGS